MPGGKVGCVLRQIPNHVQTAKLKRNENEQEKRRPNQGKLDSGHALAVANSIDCLSEMFDSHGEPRLVIAWILEFFAHSYARRYLQSAEKPAKRQIPDRRNGNCCRNVLQLFSVVKTRVFDDDRVGINNLTLIKEFLNSELDSRIGAATLNPDSGSLIRGDRHRFFEEHDRTHLDREKQKREDDGDHQSKLSCGNSVSILNGAFHEQVCILEKESSSKSYVEIAWKSK